MPHTLFDNLDDLPVKPSRALATRDFYRALQEEQGRAPQNGDPVPESEQPVEGANSTSMTRSP